MWLYVNICEVLSRSQEVKDLPLRTHAVSACACPRWNARLVRVWKAEKARRVLAVLSNPSLRRWRCLCLGRLGPLAEFQIGYLRIGVSPILLLLSPPPTGFSQSYPPLPPPPATPLSPPPVNGRGIMRLLGCTLCCDSGLEAAPLPFPPGNGRSRGWWPEELRKFVRYSQHLEGEI